MSKPRILFVGEFSQLSTGFSTMARYLLPRLVKTGKYDIAEHASYINNQHAQIDDCEWRVYANEPDPNNPKEMEMYQADRTNQFGRWKFDAICLDFKPTHVISWRDIWMDLHIFHSPYRKHFKYIHMPTCDGEPQKPEWLAMYKQADLVLTYSLFAKYQIEKYSNNAIKVFDVASPGVDTDIFKPMDRKAIRDAYGVQQDVNIVGSIMRNQPRKLFPDILRMFLKFLILCKESGRTDIANKTYLYWHTSFPDLGWDIPYELKRYNLGHKVLFTYKCDACQHVFTTFFAGDICHCPKCRNRAAHMPNTANGISREELAKINNLFDLYLQYSVAEGWALPINEAKACGVPAMAVDHSAMSEQCLNGGAFLLPVIRHFQEPASQTNQLRALPDNAIAAAKLYEFFTLDEAARKDLSERALSCVHSHYNYDNIAKIWESAIDSLDITTNVPWESPPQIHQPNLNIPDGMTHQQFVDWCYDNILGEPLKKYDEMYKKAVAALTIGYEMVQTQEGHHTRNPVDRNTIINHMLNTVNHKNQVEHRRYVVCNNLIQQQTQQLQLIEI